MSILIHYYSLMGIGELNTSFYYFLTPIFCVIIYVKRVAARTTFEETLQPFPSNVLCCEAVLDISQGNLRNTRGN